jgi:RNA polymerase sigma-70 factor, ECF subfamily
VTRREDKQLDLLAVKASRSDSDAFRQLATLIAPRAHQVAWRILSDSQLAADAVQEFLIKLISVLSGYRPEFPFWPWAQRIVTRVAIDLARREKAWLNVALEAVPDVAGPTGQQPDELLEANQESRRLREAVSFLPGRQRAIFVLRDLEEWTTAEIAAHLEMAESTVRVHRLREALLANENEGSAHGELC